MHIRALTILCAADADPAPVRALVAAARAVLPDAPQSIRVALPPFPDWAADAAAVARAAARWRAAGAHYVAAGPVLLRHDPAWLARVPELVGAAEPVFTCAEIAADGRLDTARLQAVAGLVVALARQRADGFANLYFTALAGCDAGTPWFPASWHGGGGTTCALAVEGAGAALAAIGGAATLAQARERLVAAIEAECAPVAQALAALALAHGVAFGGIDYALAPHPARERSIGAALEALGVPAAGGPGSVAAAAFLADAVQRARFPRCGFSSLMLPVLEDAVLGERARDGTLTLSALLAMCAVCGTGLDTVPLPGAATVAQLAAVLADLAALALRTGKPLTARLMPIPGARAGDPVDIPFEYFAPARVLALAGPGLAPPLAAGEPVSLLRLAARP